MADEMRVFKISAEVGNLLQKAGCSPIEGLCALLTASGRLMAREAFEDLETDSAWEHFTNRELRYFFEWGFENDRAAGHKGRPR